MKHLKELVLLIVLAGALGFALPRLFDKPHAAEDAERQAKEAENEQDDSEYGLFFEDEQELLMPEITDGYTATLDDIVFVEMQHDAVIIDMHLYLGWYPDEKDWIKKASEKAITDLQKIRRYLESLKYDGILLEIQKVSLAINDKLTDIYDGVELKNDEQIEESFAALDKLYLQCSEKSGEAVKEYMPAVNLPQDFDPKNEVLKLIENTQDRQMYLDALELMNSNNHQEAYTKLAILADKYKGTPFENCVMFNIAGCFIWAEFDDQDGQEMYDPDKGVGILSGIIDSGQYNPLLFQTFYDWRMETQMGWHGVSNMSYIANLEYNLKRRKAWQTIRQYIQTNPDDQWAGKQLYSLLALPNIGRGGLMGNDTLGQWGSRHGLDEE